MLRISLGRARPGGLQRSVAMRVWRALGIAVIVLSAATRVIAGDFEDGLKFYGDARYTEAREAFEKAAARGDARAQFQLGLIYFNGHGVVQNFQEAKSWYEKAATGGDTMAAYNLGLMYTNGEGVAKDYAKAAGWYAKAADHGDPRAQFNLGLLYANGWGVKRDDKKALDLYRKSAEQGYVGAQLNLGVMYANGVAVPQNVVEAYKWLDLAATQGDPQAIKNRATISDRMPPTYVDQAKKLADAWLAEHREKKD
jgi:uncharacterized protein